jgi:hypothetical protein
MEVRGFVPAAEPDPVYLDASYYVAPQNGGEKPYALLFEALRRSAYVGLAQCTLQHRQHLVVLRPGRFGLLAHTVFYREEVRATEEFRIDTGQISGQELELAHLLVNALAALFDPGKYQDRYCASLRALIQLQDPGRREETGRAACAEARARHSTRAAGEPACQAARGRSAGAQGFQAGDPRSWAREAGAHAVACSPESRWVFSHDKRANAEQDDHVFEMSPAEQCRPFSGHRYTLPKPIPFATEPNFTMEPPIVPCPDARHI